MILSGGINFMARRVTEEEFYNIIDKLDVTVIFALYLVEKELDIQNL